MRVYISYFNNLRNFTMNLIPVSTAKWDPEWFHGGSRNKDVVFVDKRGVVNGLRCEKLVFDEFYWNMLEFKGEECKKDCKQEPGKCGFMQLYKEQLNNMKFDDIIQEFQYFINKVAFMWRRQTLNQVYRDIAYNVDNFAIVLLVHEKPDVKCAERPVLVEWFRQHGINVEEWQNESSRS